MCGFVVVMIRRYCTRGATSPINSPTAVGAFNDFCSGRFSLPRSDWLARTWSAAAEDHTQPTSYGRKCFIHCLRSWEYHEVVFTP